MADPKRILIVDDDPQLQKLLELALKRQGYEVAIASTGEEAITGVLAFRPHLILMDVMMPDMDGYEATKRIRRMREGRDIPIIFLSALNQVDAKVKGLRVGGNDYVTKPVNLPELLARIEAHLGIVLPPMGQLITVFGAKPGVGTTGFLVNVALALHDLSPHANIIIVDWRRPMGDVATFLGLLEPPSIDMLLPGLTSIDEETMEQMLVEYLPNVRVLAGSVDPSKAQHMTMDTMSTVLETALTMADYVFVDVGSALEWEEPPLISKDMGANYCLVTPEITSVKRILHFIGWGPQEEHEVFYILNKEGIPGGIATRQLEANLHLTFAGRLPYDSEVMTRSMNMGTPAVRMAPKSKYARSVQEIARRIA